MSLHFITVAEYEYLSCEYYMKERIKILCSMPLYVVNASERLFPLEHFILVTVTYVFWFPSG